MPARRRSSFSLVRRHNRKRSVSRVRSLLAVGRRRRSSSVFRPNLSFTKRRRSLSRRRRGVVRRRRSFSRRRRSYSKRRGVYKKRRSFSKRRRSFSRRRRSFSKRRSSSRRRSHSRRRYGRRSASRSRGGRRRMRMIAYAGYSSRPPRGPFTPYGPSLGLNMHGNATHSYSKFNPAQSMIRAGLDAFSNTDAAKCVPGPGLFGYCAA